MADLNDAPDIPLGLTFDDVLLIPAHSPVVPRQVRLNTRLTRTLSLNIPLLSAAMAPWLTPMALAPSLLVGGFPVGGMSAVMKNPKAPPEVNEQAMAKVRDDKTRESGDGFDGSWVAHPDLVPLCHPVALHAVLKRRCLLSGRSRLRRFVRSCGGAIRWGLSLASVPLSCPTPPLSKAAMSSSVSGLGFGACENVFVAISNDF